MEVLKRIVFFIFVFCSLIGCDKRDKNGNCEEGAKLFREVECLQIFERLPTLASYRLKSEGTHLVTGEKCICEDQTRALNNYKHILEKGDTIIKRKGELTFSIHKKDTVIVVKWECLGKIYE